MTSTTSTSTSAPTSSAPLAVDAIRAAKLCGVSRSTWLELCRSGRAPQGVKLGRCRRWILAELMAWLGAGAPPRHKWTWKGGVA